MKKVFVFISICLLLSCQEEIFHHEFESPDKKTSIQIAAAKQGKFDSWKVETTVKSRAFEDGSLKFEILNDELKDQIDIVWQGSERAIIIFKQSDGEDRKFQLICSESQLYLGEIK